MQPPQFDQSGLIALQKYSWPGNIRELRNFIERSSVLYRGRQITAAEVSSLLSFDAEKEVEQATLWDALDDLQKQCPATGDARVAPHATIEMDYAQLLKDSPEFSLKDYMSEIELALIKTALEQGHGSVPEAAKALGVRRTTLIEKLKKFGMNANAVSLEAGRKIKSKQGVAL
jgi:sigma-54 dependent transcriptional regulator, flagellar regulatory protein